MNKIAAALVLLAGTATVAAAGEVAHYASATVSGLLVSVVSYQTGDDCTLWIDTGDKVQLPVAASFPDCLIVDPGQELLIRATVGAVAVPVPAVVRKPPSFRVEVRLHAVTIEVLSP